MNEIQETMLDVLIFVFQHYMSKDGVVSKINQGSLIADLERAGFRSDEVTAANHVLEMLGQVFEKLLISQQAEGGNALRVYTPAEMEKIDILSRGFLLFLEALGVLGASAREWAIEQAMQLDMDVVKLSHLKWLVLMALVNESVDAEVPMVQRKDMTRWLMQSDSVH